ncbi:MAG: acetate/propionate family kinase [Thermodesulfobacteriota bacterium]
MDDRVLTINSGSSSIKFSLYEVSNGCERKILSGRLERIGLGQGSFLAVGPSSGVLADEALDMPGHDAALERLFGWLSSRPEGALIAAAGHRVVFGGPRYDRPHRVDAELLAALKGLAPFATEHLPHEIKAIEAVARVLPELPQFACFDTSFHMTMPQEARTFALPLELRDEGVVRYGFHGLSYEYVVSQMGPLDERCGARMVVAHLGNGASMAAIENGVSVDTTMGLTPTGGLVMSTRSGDLDPGIIVYLLREKGLGAEGLNELLNKRSGLLGLSGISPSMEDLLESGQRRAQLAVEIFCRQARKFIGALSASLGGLDTVVFTGGIGENSPLVRERICAPLGFLGLSVDPQRNGQNAGVISKDGGRVTVRVIRTNEELMIARHTGAMLRGR